MFKILTMLIAIGLFYFPLKAENLYIDLNSTAANHANGKVGNLTDESRKLMEKVAEGTQSRWFSQNWIPNLKEAVDHYTTEAANQASTPIIVLYDIPNRDCGSYSAGGVNVEKYKQGVNDLASGIGNRKVIVILEPDALGQMDSLPSMEAREERFHLLQYAVSTLKRHINTVVYIDSGNPGWKSAKEMAERLSKAGIQEADGFALNVSNFYTDQENIQYGNQINEELSTLGFPAKHFVIDSSRNGNGSKGSDEWCNPSGRALGRLPTTNTGNPFVDAYLWIKIPGESDGDKDGAPAAGTFWIDYALELARNSKW